MTGASGAQTACQRVIGKRVQILYDLVTVNGEQFRRMPLRKREGAVL